MLFIDLRRKQSAIFLALTPKSERALSMVFVPSKPAAPKKKTVQPAQSKTKTATDKKTTTKKEVARPEKKDAPEKPKPVEKKNPPKQEQKKEPIKKQEAAPKKTEPEEIHVSAQEKLHQEFYEQLLSFWSAPAGMAPEKPCQVKAEIDWQGKVYSCTIESSSGIALYDISAQSIFYEMKMPQWTWGKSLYVTFNE